LADKSCLKECFICHKGLPFEIKIPNDETLAAMSEAEQLNGDFVSIDDFVK
jgi:antitoxin component of RelBE/YafQ-DinJ toxin-antitoxin module